MELKNMAFPPQSDLPLNQRVTVDINGYPAKVWDFSRKERVSQDIHTQGATWIFGCLWADRIPIANALIGGGVAAGGSTVYLNGWPYPDNPAWLCKLVETEPDPQMSWPKGEGLSEPGTVLANFQRAKMTVTFGVPEFQVGTPNNLGEQELDFCSNSVPQTGTTSGLFWADHTPLPADINIPITYSTIKFTQTIYNRKSLPIALAESLTDHVNSVEFFGGPPGTVIFRGGRSRRKITPKGPMNWDITWSFEFNGSIAGNGTQSGWNKMWKPTVGWSDFFTDAASTKTLFASGDLNQLLQ